MKNTQQNKVEMTEKKFIPDIIRYIINHSCIYFTLLSLVLLFIQYVTSENATSYIEPSRFLLLFPFALCISVAECIFKAKSLNIFIKVLIHYVAFVISFYVFVCAPTANLNKPFVIMALITVLYFIAATPVLVIRGVIKKKQKESVPYESVYKNVFKDTKK